ncbi:RDAC family protein [Oceanivirga salmonicida]|uniref:RDAC family protein n=1 Tax=Oceanivirga salmonicida TaxID=1769291 RepID=UPI00082A08DE|nr:hypothetical protein [Oceanivirga salmonicida]
MRKSNLTFDIFLELQEKVPTKLHLRDACGSTVIEIEAKEDTETIEIIKKFFEEKNMQIEFSKDKKYVYEV